jgi:hypothetical protein
MSPADLKRLALIMTVNCVRNTVIVDYHSQGKLDDTEMMTFNREVANKIYTFLTYMFNKSDEDNAAFLGAASMMYPTNWDQPKIDQELSRAAKLYKKMHDRVRDSPGDNS